MKAGELFSKTLPFVWAKLLLGLATVVISAVIFAVLMGIAFLIRIDGVWIVLFGLWVGATGVVNFILNHYIGYLIKAGHIAVITEAVTTGSVPNNQVAYGKQMVKERFLTSNVYFVVDKLVSGAVRQIQRVVEKVGDTMSFIPGMKAVVGIAKMFLGIALGYIDECCLGYTFLKKKQSAFKSACDGVVIYAQNWKKLLQDAAKTTAIVVLLLIAVTILVFALFALLFNLLQWNLLVAFLLAVLVAVAAKKAFIDSYMMVKMMVSYMEVAPDTKITVDIYSKLCGWSVKFKELFNKGQNESPGQQPSNEMEGAKTQKGAASDTEKKSVFCGQCGAKNEAGTKFCGGCGNKL